MIAEVKHTESMNSSKIKNFTNCFEGKRILKII